MWRRKRLFKSRSFALSYANALSLTYLEEYFNSNNSMLNRKREESLLHDLLTVKEKRRYGALPFAGASQVDVYL
jgi:hypothetical protein